MGWWVGGWGGALLGGWWVGGGVRCLRACRRGGFWREGGGVLLRGGVGRGGEIRWKGGVVWGGREWACFGGGRRLVMGGQGGGRASLSSARGRGTSKAAWQQMGPHEPSPVPPQLSTTHPPTTRPPPLVRRRPRRQPLKAACDTRLRLHQHSQRLVAGQRPANHVGVDPAVHRALHAPPHPVGLSNQSRVNTGQTRVKHESTQPPTL